MKKLFPIAMVAGLALMFTSCKKDYTCTCTITGGGTSTVYPALTIPKTTKSDAKSKCSTYESAGNSTFGAGTTKCSI